MLEDFGKKIGGARKDTWKARALSVEELYGMTEAEQVSLVTKDAVWPKPDYKALHESGIPKDVCFYIKKVRDAAPVRPLPYQDRTAFVELLSDVRDSVMGCTTHSDMYRCASCLETLGYVERTKWSVSCTKKAGDCLDNKLYRAVRSGTNPEQIMREARKKGFLMSEDEKLLRKYTIIQFDPLHMEKYPGDKWQKPCVVVSYPSSTYYYYPAASLDDVSEDGYMVIRDHTLILSGIKTREEAEAYALLDAKGRNDSDTVAAKKRKTALRPPQLAQIERIGGKDYRKGTHCTGDEYVTELAFRGGEYGNWTNQKDRQANLDMCYDALRDLAEVIGAEPDGVSLGGELAIAFGARGKGAALAHYEPMANVINLTKMKGAGSLGHEWIHALDDYLGRISGTPFIPKTGHMLSETPYPGTTPEAEAMNALMDRILYTRKDGMRLYTKFYKDARFFDGMFTKAGHGYWTSRCELLARAGAAYIKDKCAERGIRNDYLSGHADGPGISDKGVTHYTSPQGSEREAINAAFDELFKTINRTGALRRSA